MNKLCISLLGAIAITDVTADYFGGIAASAILENVACDGSEYSLYDCVANTTNTGQCGSSSIAGVVCQGLSHMQFEVLRS